NKQTLIKEFTANEKIVLKRFNIYKMQAKGEQTTVRVTADLAMIKTRKSGATERVEKKNWTAHLVNEAGIWRVWDFISSEEELATAIIAAKTDEERKTLIEKEPALLTPDLAAALINQNYLYDPATHQQALTINQLAYKIADQTGDKSVLANVLINFGHIYGLQGTPDKSYDMAMDAAQKSLKIGEEFGLKGIICKSLICLAFFSQLQNDLSLAAEYYQKSLEFFDEFDDINLKTRALGNLGYLNQIKGNYAKAMKYALQGLKIIESKLDSGADWVDLSGMLLTVGTIFQCQGNFEQALAYFQRAYEAAEKGAILGDRAGKSWMASSFVSLGKLYLLQGNNSLAMEYFEKALKADESN